MGSLAQDLTGKHFGRWTALERVANRGVVPYWRCICECGTEREVAGYSLRNGASQSCGCWAAEAARDRAKHGAVGTPEYETWQGMIGRCHNPANHAFDRYGGRGIKVCTRWRHSFKSFLRDMGLKPSPKHSIDRINNDGDYEPNNCRWATDKQQARNTSRNRLLTYDGETRTLAEWAERAGMSRETLKNRLRLGWSLDDALSKPIRKCESRLLTYHGETLCLAQWAKRLGIGYSTLQQRLDAGWSVEDALGTPVRSQRPSQR